MGSDIKMASARKRRLEQTKNAPQNQRSQARLASSVDYAKLNALFQQGDYACAEQEAQRQVACVGRLPHLIHFLGTVCLRQQRDEEAAACLLEACANLPDNWLVFNQLGIALNRLRRFQEADVAFERALRLSPENPIIWVNHGDNLTDMSRPMEALPWLEKAVAVAPHLREAHVNLAGCLLALDRYEEAWQIIKPHISAGYQSPAALHHYSRLLALKGRLSEAKHYAIQLLQKSPENADALTSFGKTLCTIGEITAGLAALHKAVTLNPFHEQALSSLLFHSNYIERGTPLERRALAEQYGRAVSIQSEAETHKMPQNRPQKLRIGFVSGDLNSHPVGYFLEAILPKISAEAIELIAFPTSIRTDGLTQRLRQWFIHWESLAGISDVAAAELIWAKNVDILIDLSGHTSFHRLPLFARKPAPIQVTWLGYFATTGVAQIDYILVDETGVPPENQDHFTEKVWYLPDTRLCFSPPAEAAEVAPLPAQQRGELTFGCFQTLTKITDDVLKLWGKIFQALPQARLRVQCQQFFDPDLRKSFAQRLSCVGIEPDRVSLLPRMDRKEYLAAHGEVDILLDTFPYPGGTTTCEALWMGVPTITLAGDSLLSRQGASLLTAAGLIDWVAHNENDYVSKAIAFGSAIPALAALRARLRDQVAASPLFDAERFAKNFTVAMNRIWEAFIREQRTQ